MAITTAELVFFLDSTASCGVEIVNLCFFSKLLVAKGILLVKRSDS